MWFPTIHSVSVFIFLILSFVFHIFLWWSHIPPLPQHFIMKIFKNKEKLKKFHSEHLCIYHPGSIININICFISYIPSYGSYIHQSTLMAFQNKLQASIHFLLNSFKACLLLPEFCMCLQFCFLFWGKNYIQWNACITQFWQIWAHVIHIPLFTFIIRKTQF